jgi:hypothetical protein
VVSSWLGRLRGGRGKEKKDEEGEVGGPRRRPGARVAAAAAGDLEAGGGEGEEKIPPRAEQASAFVAYGFASAPQALCALLYSLLLASAPWVLPVHADPSETFYIRI